MKKEFKIIILLLFVSSNILIFHSCRKGEEDPVISLRSRSKRLEGVWSLKSLKTVINENGSIYTNDFNGAVSIINYNGITEIRGYSKTLTFKKDGTFLIEEKITRDLNNTGIASKEVRFITEKGTWDFNDGEGNQKSKSKVLLRVTAVVNITTITSSSGSSTSSDIRNYNDNSFSYAMYLTKLSNDELKISYKYSETVTASGAVQDNYDGLTTEVYTAK